MKRPRCPKPSGARAPIRKSARSSWSMAAAATRRGRSPKNSAAPSGRGGQMRAGARQTQGDVVLLLHADTWLPPEAGHAVMNCLRDNTVVAGGFWKRFNHTPFLLLGSRWKCAVRMIFGRRIVGD